MGIKTRLVTKSKIGINKCGRISKVMVMINPLFYLQFAWRRPYISDDSDYRDVEYGRLDHDKGQKSYNLLSNFDDRKYF